MENKWWKGEKPTAHYSIYCAEQYHKEHNGKYDVVIHKSDFASRADMELYLDELRKCQKEKNSNFSIRKKEAMKKILYENNNITNNNTNTQYDLINNKIKIPQELNVDLVEYSSYPELILDKQTGNTTALLGAGKAGKSTLMMSLYKKYYSHPIIISTLFSMNPHIAIYEDNPELLICPTFNKRCENLITMMKHINQNCNNKYEFLVMFDDVLNTRQKSLIDNLILSFRNSLISTILSVQYSKMISKANRANLNNIFLGAFRTEEAIRDIVTMYLKSKLSTMGIRNIEDQMAWYKQVTKNHGFIYLNNDHMSFVKL